MQSALVGGFHIHRFNQGHTDNTILTFAAAVDSHPPIKSVLVLSVGCYTRIFPWAGVSAPNPHIVEGSCQALFATPQTCEHKDIGPALLELIVKGNR